MTEQVSGITDVTYNPISVIYHALQGAENYVIYARDDDTAGEGEIAQFLNQLVSEERLRAEITPTIGQQASRDHAQRVDFEGQPCEFGRLCHRRQCQ